HGQDERGETGGVDEGEVGVWVGDESGEEGEDGDEGGGEEGVEEVEKVMVVGWGVRGGEFASAYNGVGCEVTLVSSGEQVLAG
ncbi:NAD-binding protein, partial [Kocuria rhizophila]|uniref:NAD-binding protein n=1 Tax=Kocuria rhizophila TaxID=72000 RepID=UPI0011A074B0